MLYTEVVVAAVTQGQWHKGPGMGTTETSEGAVRAEGVVVRVDLVNRELTVRFADGPRVVDVPPDCLIILHGERVRLRLVQPRDHVRVTYSEYRDSRTASAVEVQGGRPPAPPTRPNCMNSVVRASPESQPARSFRGILPTGQ